MLIRPLCRADAARGSVVNRRRLAGADDLASGRARLGSLSGLRADQRRRCSVTSRAVRSLASGSARLRSYWPRKMASGELETHGLSARSTPMTELPADWPAEYRELVERRIALIEIRSRISLSSSSRVQAALEHRAMGAAAGARVTRLAARRDWKPQSSGRRSRSHERQQAG